ncbi:MAG: sugar phosphate nucleotidyltransferase [Candidatus Bathyarchaeia archaeon]
MRALILGGGYGTRLRPLTCTKPKILLPVANKPLVDWTIGHLKNSGIVDITLAVGYMAGAIQDHVKKIPGINASFSLEETPLGTGGAVKNAFSKVGFDEPFIVINGDVIAFPDYARLIAAHKRSGAIATIAAHRVKKPERFGAVLIGEDNRIERFVEKPRRRISNLINAGIYLLDPGIFDFIPNGKVSIEREVFPTLCERRLIHGFELEIESTWVDIGLTEDYILANRLLLHTIERKILFSESAQISEHAKISGEVVIGENAEIERRAQIVGPTAIGGNVVVKRYARIRESIVLPGVVIGEYAKASESIIGENSVVGERAELGKGCVIGEGAVVRDETTLAPFVRVCPYKEVEESVLEPGSYVV